MKLCFFSIHLLRREWGVESHPPEGSLEHCTPEFHGPLADLHSLWFHAHFVLFMDPDSWSTPPASPNHG